jgi:tetratricopeptide (TPR) repeat protein
LAEQVHDPVYISFWNNCLAMVVQNQGKFDDAKKLLVESIKIGRAIKFVPSIGYILVAIGQLRIAEASSGKLGNNHMSLEHEHGYSSEQLLRRARGTLQHALSLEGLEAETRTEGLLALAHISFLLGGVTTAQQIVHHALEEAIRYDQVWLLACTQRLLGSILAWQGKYEESAIYFTQSSRTLEERGMRLEWTRTKRDYNVTLLRKAHSENSDCNQAITHLQEARKVFEECGAALDLELVDRALAAYTSPIEATIHKRDRQ